jgi:hypothetical protein
MSKIRLAVQIIQETESLTIQTPMTCRGVCRAQKENERDPIRQILELIFWATSQLAVQSSI